MCIDPGFLVEAQAPCIAASTESRLLNMLRGAWLACLVACVPAAAKPVHGDPFSPTPPACPAKEYPKHHKVCDDLQFCNEPGKVCLPCGWGPDQTNVAACCYKKDLPLPNERGHYPCEWKSVVLQNGTSTFHHG